MENFEETDEDYAQNFDKTAKAYAQQMLENLRHNVAEDKRRRALLHGVADSEEVPVDDVQYIQVSRCCP